VSEAIDLSVVVPLHDEEDNVEPLWSEIQAVLDGLGLQAEVVYVNDGSTDGTSSRLDALRAADPRVRVIDHEGNHGLTAALDTGFRAARGRLVAMLDGDGQNPPDQLPRLLAKIEEADVVIGWCRDRDDPWIRRISSRIANAYRNWRTREKVHDTGCGLKVFRREVLARIKLYNGLHRFLPTLARMEGFRVTEVVVTHRPRRHGRSHFGVWNRLWKGLRDVRTIRWMWRYRIHAPSSERPSVER
jgi:glycosyltransferase involved in cell wall biosynthesis